ncbi:MAG: hypothetical protein ACRCUT_06945 [Spirochaetota bacterium]
MKIFFYSMMLLLSGAVSCSTMTMTTPEGFVLFDKEKYYKAVSADSVYLKGRCVSEDGIKENNDPSTWEKEIDRSLCAKGYTFISRTEIPLSSGFCMFREYSVLFNGESYSYAVGFSLQGNKAFYVEAGGRKDLYAARRGKILAAVATAEMK